MENHICFLICLKIICWQRVWIREHIIEIAFDSFENKKFRDPEVLYPYMKEQMQDEDMYYVLLDEVQLLDEFEAVLNSLIRMKNVDIYVTGSNAHFLSKDVITEFRGRGMKFICTRSVS